MHIDGISPLTARLLQDLNPAGTTGKTAADALLATAPTPGHTAAAPPPASAQADMASLSPMMMAILVQTQIQTPPQTVITPDDASDADEENADDMMEDDADETPDDDTQSQSSSLDTQSQPRENDEVAETASLPWEADDPPPPEPNMSQERATFYRHQFD